MAILKTLRVTTTINVIVDEATGEITYQVAKPTQVKSNFKVVEEKPRKAKKEEGTSPQLVLEDNKYSLNNAAVSLMGIEAGVKLDIKYEKRDKVMVPVLGPDDAFGTKGGNLLTKSNTVACRGSKHTELSKYGKVFEVKPHESKEGLFILIGDTIKEELPSKDEIVIEDTELPEEIDFTDLVEDANVEQIDPSYFQL